MTPLFKCGVLLSCCGFALGGCASVTDTSDNSTSETPCEGDECDCTGSDCDIEDECKKDSDCAGDKVCTKGKCTNTGSSDPPPVTDKCPSKDYSACDDSGTKRRFCKDGKLESEICEAGCQSGTCTVPNYTNNSCDNPYIVQPNKVITGSTASGATYTPSLCSSELKSMMGVFKLEVPETGRYEISISNKSENSWGNLLATECPMQNIIINFHITS